MGATNRDPVAQACGPCRSWFIGAAHGAATCRRAPLPSGGQFVEQDGWVKIVVGEEFFKNKNRRQPRYCAIELCHYVLEANGIRERLTLENERLTDAAIFVFGPVKYFFAAIRKVVTQSISRPSLKHLDEQEYRFVDHHARWLRTSEEFLQKRQG